MAEETRTKIAAMARFLTGHGPGQSRMRATAGQVVCPQGAPDNTLFYIEQGWVKISVVSPVGKDAVLALRGAGDFLGTRCLIEGHRRAAAATMLTECSLVRITRTAAIRLLRTEPDFAEMLAIYLALQGQRDQASLAEQLTDSSEQRLARALLRLANDGGDRKSQQILAPINQADLASMIGTTRSRVSYFMNRFRRQGLIDYNRHGYITVHNSLTKVLRGG